jgi:hypothetical protein
VSDDSAAVGVGVVGPEFSLEHPTALISASDAYTATSSHFVLERDPLGEHRHIVPNMASPCLGSQHYSMYDITMGLTELHLDRTSRLVGVRCRPSDEV